jgi:hypothetical protein
MKRLLLAFFGLLLILPVAPMGCVQPNTTPATQALAPGYSNAADQQMGEILSGAHAFYNSIQQQSQAGTLILSADMKQKFNAFGVSLNAAQAVYLAYHAGTATQAEAQTAVSKVQTEQAALPLPGAGL